MTEKILDDKEHFEYINNTLRETEEQIRKIWENHTSRKGIII